MQTASLVTHRLQRFRAARKPGYAKPGSYKAEAEAEAAAAPAASAADSEGCKNQSFRRYRNTETSRSRKLAFSELRPKPSAENSLQPNFFRKISSHRDARVGPNGNFYVRTFLFYLRDY